MRDVVAAAAERALQPGVDEVEDQRRVRRDRRVQRTTAAARRGSARRRRTRRRVPVGCSGTRRPLQVTTWRSAVRPVTLHLRVARATNRRSAPCRRPAGSSPSTCHGSSARRSSSSMPRVATLADAREAELEVRREPLARRRRSRRRARSSSTSRKSCSTKCGSMKRSWSSVPQRASARGGTARARSARPARAAAAAARRLMRACGGISKARSSSRPRRPVGAVGRVQLVDAELGAVRVAGDVDQQVAERRGRPATAAATSPLPRLGGSARRRSRARRARRCAPRRRAAPGSSGR